jgi:hypothetical protein
MRSITAFLVLFPFLMFSASAQDTAATTNNAPATAAPTQSTFDRLTQSNHELLELLKKQQSVLEDIQYDRKLLDRQIQTLEERLTDSIQQNAQLQVKIAKLEAAQAAGPSTTPNTNSAPAQPAIPQVTEPPPPPPSTYRPPPESAGAPGTLSWHRLFTLSGEDSKKSDLFGIQAKQWRVLWHNQDQPGDAYKNTSALFINAFPKDDTVPQKVCSKVGSGDDSAELIGPGNFYLKVEASGGSWELAVEEFR